MNDPQDQAPLKVKVTGLEIRVRPDGDYSDRLADLAAAIARRDWTAALGELATLETLIGMEQDRAEHIADYEGSE